MIIKILQWNILYKENPENIVKFLKKNKSDIITLQELIINKETHLDVPKYIAEELKYHYFFKESDTWTPAKNNKTSQNNGIFSRFPIIKKKFFYLSSPYHNPPDANFEGRVYVECSFKINQKTINIGTTHLGFSPKFIMTNKRKKEVDKLINIIKNKKSNYILTGDLNCSPKSYIIDQIKQYLSHAGPSFNQPTWTTKPFNYHGQFKEDKLRWRLDYIFVSNDMRIINSKIIKTNYSDHLPILLIIDI